MNKLASHDEFIKFIDEVSVSLVSKITGLAASLEGLLDRSLVIDSDLTKLSEKTDGVIDIAEAESRVARLEKIHNESGLAKDYSGTGWYKAIDTGIVYNKDVPEGETYKFEGDPTEYISVWENKILDLVEVASDIDELEIVNVVRDAYDYYRNMSRYATSNMTDMSHLLTLYNEAEQFPDYAEELQLEGYSNVEPLTVPNITHFDTSNVTNMDSMFSGAESFNQDIGNWDTSSVTNMRNMFKGAYLFNQDIGKWDVSNVTDMSYMFCDTKFNQNINDWDVSNVTNMEGFLSVTYLSKGSYNHPLNKWNVSNVTNMKRMFSQQVNFTQDLNSWDVSNVLDMSYMFSMYILPDFTSKTNPSVESWQTKNVIDMSGMFGDCKSFNGDISNWDTSSVTNMHEMFRNAASFNQDISAWDTSSVTNMTYMFFKASSFNQDLSNWCVSNVASKPVQFNDGATNWTLPKPVWGTCPRGENQA